jgi:hypothetical protein
MQTGESMAKVSTGLRVLLALIAIFLYTQTAAAQDKTSAQSSSKSPPTTCCSDKVKAARTAGFNDGIQQSETSCAAKIKDAKSSAFLSGFTAGEGLGITDLKSAEGKIPISISCPSPKLHPDATKT